MSISHHCKSLASLSECTKIILTEIWLVESSFLQSLPYPRALGNADCGFICPFINMLSGRALNVITGDRLSENSEGRK